MPFPDLFIFLPVVSFIKKQYFSEKLHELIGLGIFIPTDYDTSHSDTHN